VIDRQIGDAAKKGRFGWFNQGNYLYSTCYIENLKEAVSKALDTKQTGQAFFISDGKPMIYRHFMTRRLAIDHYPIPKFSIPNQLAWALASFTENGWRHLPLKGAPPITREMVRLTGYSFTVSIKKAKELLTYEPIFTVEQGLEHLGRVIT
jgi:2-alkyl-3-oxoalkanoate reductase